jgi:hypothetical protein
MNCMRTPSQETSWPRRAYNERAWRLNLEPECRPIALHVSRGRRGIVGADDQDPLVGPFGEQLRAGGRRALGVAVVACRPLGMRHLTGMMGYITALCPSDWIITLTWPGVWPGVGLKYTSGEMR